MSFDPKVWTSEKPDRNLWYWFAENGGNDDAPWLDCRATLPAYGCVRSIHSIPSAKRIAVLEELAEIVCNNRNDPDHMAFLLDAAISRLEASRG